MRPCRLRNAAFVAALLAGVYGYAPPAAAQTGGTAGADQSASPPASQSSNPAAGDQAGSQPAAPARRAPGMGSNPHRGFSPGMYGGGGHGPGMMGYGAPPYDRDDFGPGMRSGDEPDSDDGYGPGMWGGYGPGMMGWGGPGARGGYGPGMWGGYGPGMMGYGPGMWGGYGPGMMGWGGPYRGGWSGPGMMWGDRRGAVDDDPSMMGGAYGPWMMHRWMGAGPGCGAWAGGSRWAHPRNLDLSVQDVQKEMQRWLDWHRNPHLKLGAVKEQNADTVTADIVTQDDSLVQRFEVDRHTGRFHPANE